MKIRKEIQTSTHYPTNRRMEVGPSDQKKGFSDFLQQEKGKDPKEILKQLLNNIDEQGKKLSQYKNLKELRAYKELIKQFMDETVKLSIQLEERVSYDRLGRTKKMKIIKEIDRKLLELTDLTLQKETDQIKLLDQIGEIKGLLVNLYF